MARDVIELRGLRVDATHGVLPEERRGAQPFEVDLDVELDLSQAAASDRLEDTLDYAALVAVAESVLAGEPVSLLETLAERVAAAVLVDSRVDAVTVAIRKLQPPVPAQLATAGVRVRRTQPG